MKSNMYRSVNNSQVTFTMKLSAKVIIKCLYKFVLCMSALTPQQQVANRPPDSPCLSAGGYLTSRQSPYLQAGG